MRIAITGPTGFLGRALAALLADRGHAVRALVVPGVPLPAVLAGRVEKIEGTLATPAPVARLVEGAEVLVHLAAAGVQSRDRDWRRMTEVNVVEPLALVDAASQAGVARVIAAGTCLEYAGHGRLPEAPVDGDPRCSEDDPLEPEDPYGATKAAGGLLMRARCRALGLPCWHLRLAGVYGAGDDRQKLLPAAVRAACAREPFEMSEGEQVREIMHLADALDAFAAAVARTPPPGGRAVNVGTGSGLTIAELVRLVFRVAGADPALVRVGARPYRPREPHRIVMDVTRAAQELGWRARRPLEAGLSELVAAG